MTASTFILDTVDDTPVHVHCWLPDGDATGVVQIVHGVAEHAARYAHVAERLTRDGWAVYADDHRGHGLSVVDDDQLGLYADSGGWELVLDDLVRLTAHARREHPDVPLVLLGHSGGSTFCQEYLFTHAADVDAMILSGIPSAPNALGRIADIAARVERRRLGRRGRSRFLDSMAFGRMNQAFEPARTEFDWLSADPDVVDAYVDDPRCGFTYPTQLWLDVLTGLGRADDASARSGVPNDLPVYLFAGAMDPVGDQGESVRALGAAYDEAGLHDVTQRLYTMGRHEMLNEVNRDEVMDDLVDWLTHHVPRGSS